jgi:hypothetical protein
MKEYKKDTEKMYRDYLNNYLTVDVFASCYEISLYSAKRLINYWCKIYWNRGDFNI